MTLPNPVASSVAPFAATDPEVLLAGVTLTGEQEPRVGLTQAALVLLRRLVERHGTLMFHQSGGCCDGSAPMCFAQGDFITSEADVLLGRFELPLADGSTSPVEFWMSAEQFTRWQHTRLTIDVVEGRGAGFSLEAPEGKRFLIRSRVLGA